MRLQTYFHTIVTKRGKNYKQAQTTTNKYKRSQTTSQQQPQTTSNQPQTTTNYQQMTTNYQQMTTNYQQTTINKPPTNQQADILILLSTLDNYKDSPYSEKHRQSVRGNCLLLSQYLCGASKIGYVCFGRLSS